MILNQENYPDLKILDAVAMSIAVPFLFLPVKYKNQYYIDAFLVNIHPVNLGLSNSKKSLSFCLESSNEYIDTITLDIYLRIIFNSPISKLQKCFLEKYKGTTIKIKCNHKFNAEFNIDETILKEFFDSGYNTINDV